MTAKNARASELVRYGGLDEMPAAQSLGKAVKTMGDAEIERRASRDADAGAISEGFWDKTQAVEPEGTEQITLRLPRRVVWHFKATGKGDQTSISRVLASYVDAVAKKMG